MKILKLLILCIVLISTNSASAQNIDIRYSGDIIQIALPVTFLSTQLIFRDKKGTLQFVETMATSLVITHTLKRLINKPRPYGGGTYSFPSGHTASAFTGAACLERRYGLKIGVPAYMLASYVGWTRVYSNKHDYWDVFAGAMVGVGSVYLFAKPLKKKVKIALAKSDDSYLLQLKFPF